jgi:hypothetical protein
MTIIREKLAATKAPRAKRKPVLVGNAAAAEAIKNRWRTEDAIRDANARTLALADIVEKIPGVAEAVELEARRKALAPVWAENPEGSIFFLHAVSAGLFGRKVADAVLKIASGADDPFTVTPDLQIPTIGKFLQLTMPSLYSRRAPMSDALIRLHMKLYKAEPLSEAEAEELHSKLWHETDYFAGWNVADIRPNAIAIGIWGVNQKLPKNNPTFESMAWDAPWHVDELLFAGLTCATVGDWDDPCPVGLVELDAIMNHAAGEDFGTRQWVIELGAFNRAKMPPVILRSVPSASTLKMGAVHE